MLTLKNITKIYKMDTIEQKALDNVSINFRKNEFVSILGQSGSGKSTLLNIIGGLDHYTTGELIINGISTKEYKDSNWDTYRNHKIGFIFQSYNLIGHQSVLSNVELALTLSGVSKSERKKRATEALKKVGLGEHINKKPRQLSGGQMQRVAIARALVNNPDIILADEPTGALDSETSVQIMDLLKEVAKEKLVIMVTHNPELAQKYSTRIVSLKDGHIIDDTEPFDGNEATDSDDNKKRSSMSLLTALSLSKNNLMTKRGRTLVTAIAGSIGIIGIALVLSLSNGVTEYANNMQKESSATQAVSMESTASVSDTGTQTDTIEIKNEKNEHKDTIVAKDDISTNLTLSSKSATKKNNLQKMKEYIEQHKNETDKFSSFIQYTYNVNIQLYDTGKNGNITKINPIDDSETSDEGILGDLFSINLLKNSFKELKNSDQYEVVSGTMPKSKNELALVVDENNELSLTTMYSLDIEDRADIAKFTEKASNGEKVKAEDISYDFDKLIGKTYRIIKGSDYYQKVGNTWVSRENDSEFIKELYNKAPELKITGIIKVKDKNTPSGFLGYTHELIEDYMNTANETEIVKEQMANKNINIFTGEAFDGINSTYEKNLKILGSGKLENPYTINIYPKDANSKAEIKKFIETYNNQANEEDKIIYVDQMESLTQGISQIVSMISMVMIAFVAISLIVSSLMIGIITYISVLERTKEIGILRAIGASKKDVKRVFRAETIIEGLASGVLGIAVSFILSLGINAIVSLLAKIDNIMLLSPVHAIILILISMGLTVFSGIGPASMASKKDPVESLKTE
ncbi:MAG: ATP-binding cassette domain-containing protein [Clostridia bacterium]|nr:ATP-binding cassette domain-containing protein [Clostridia bacterium]